MTHLHAFLKKIIRNANAKASYDRISFLINTFYGWAKLNRDDDTFFLVIAGDKYNVQSAFFNSFGVTCDGAMAVSECPEMAGIIASLQGSVDLLLEDKQNDTDFQKRYEKAMPEVNDVGETMTPIYRSVFPRTKNPKTFSL